MMFEAAPETRTIIGEKLNILPANKTLLPHFIYSCNLYFLSHEGFNSFLSEGGMETTTKE